MHCGWRHRVPISTCPAIVAHIEGLTSNYPYFPGHQWSQGYSGPRTSYISNNPPISVPSGARPDLQLAANDGGFTALNDSQQVQVSLCTIWLVLSSQARVSRALDMSGSSGGLRQYDVSKRLLSLPVTTWTCWPTSIRRTSVGCVRVDTSLPFWPVEERADNGSPPIVNLPSSEGDRIQR